MRAQEFISQSSILDESMASRIDQWIEDALAKITGQPKDWDKMTPYMSAKVDQAAAAAPTEPLSREVIDKILNDEKIKKEIERLAWQRRTSVEKIKSIVHAFGGKFVERAIAKWRGMSDRQRRELVTDTLKALMELVLIILKALAKSKR